MARMISLHVQDALHHLQHKSYMHSHTTHPDKNFSDGNGPFPMYFDDRSALLLSIQKGKSVEHTYCDTFAMRLLLCPPQAACCPPPVAYRIDQLEITRQNRNHLNPAFNHLHKNVSTTLNQKHKLPPQHSTADTTCLRHTQSQTQIVFATLNRRHKWSTPL